jgi:hypothetical protein
MYGRLRYVYVDVHGNNDDVRQNGDDDARNGLHASRLRSDVRNDDGLHDARFADVQQDVRDVFRHVHDVRRYVHEDGQRRDETLRRDVQALCRIVRHDGQDGDGRVNIGFQQ